MRLGKLVLAASCIAAFSSSLGAQASGSLRRLDLQGTVGDMLDRLGREPRMVRTKVVGVDTADSAFLFPSAGSVQGAGGTYFRSDVTLVNHRTTDQAISVGWIAQGVNNSSAPLQFFTLTANTPVILADFVGQTLHKTGLGAVLVTGIGSTGNPDTNATLDGFSRIWTNQPGAQGTVSLAFPSITFFDSLGSATAYGLGLRHDTGYRSNVGIVNLDSVAHTWTVSINGLHGTGTFTITVDPISMKQVALPAGNYGDLLVSISTTATGFWWSAYGASVDNVSGDGWVSHASQP